MGFNFNNQSRYSCFLILILVISCSLVLTRGQISLDQQVSLACPLVESIIKTTVTAYFQLDQTIAPGLLKLFIHDCFVEGCDASVLISGPNTERTAEANLNLRGFEIIDDIKTQLEKLCPGIVSCADILALAARDSVLLTKGTSWEVKLGRKDGLISVAANVANLPFLSNSIPVLLNNFAAFGFNTEEFVALMIGGDTIGNATCKWIAKWIYNTIDSTFLDEIKSVCPKDGVSAYRLLQQFLTFKRFQTILGRAMDNLSGMGWKTGVNGEIRTNCSAVN